MGKAIGMVELSSIARGIETSDFMVKAAQVDLIRSSTVCPGKYIIIVGGDTGDVKAAMEEGLAKGGAYVVDSLRISNVHEQLIPALTGTVAVESPGAVGVLEFYSVASAILAADEAAKAANITMQKAQKLRSLVEFSADEKPKTRRKPWFYRKPYEAKRF